MPTASVLCCTCASSPSSSHLLPTPAPTPTRRFVDEDAIREQEQQRAVDLLAKQTERLKQQVCVFVCVCVCVCGGGGERPGRQSRRVLDPK